LLEDAKAGRPLQGPVPTSSTGAVASAGVSPLSPSSTQALLSHSGASLAATPPLSPQKAGGVGSFRDTPPGSPLSPSRGSRLVPPGTPPRAPTPPGAKSTLRSPALASAAKENSAADRSSTKENETPSDSSYLAVPRFYNGTESGAFSEEQSCAKLKLAKELFGGKELDVDGFKVLATGTYYYFPKSRHFSQIQAQCSQPLCDYLLCTTGNSYQYWQLLQIHHKCTVCGIQVTNMARKTDPFFYLSQMCASSRRFSRRS
jgi:hypothetical protein